jgi:hypothetical protein
MKDWLIFFWGQVLFELKETEFRAGKDAEKSKSNSNSNSKSK